MAYDHVEAIPLIAQDSDDRPDDDSESYAIKHPIHSSGSLNAESSSSSRSLSTILLTSAFLVSLVSLLWNAYTLTTTYRAVGIVSAVKRISVDELRRPSLYLGLERMPKYPAANRHGNGPFGAPASGASLGPEMPTEMARVNSRYSNTSFEQDGWVLLTEDDHTLMSFSVPPPQPGTTHCAFLGTFPRRRDLGLEAPVQLLTLERDDGSRQPPLISLTALDPPADFRLAGVKWLTRPQAATEMTPRTLSAAFGTNVTSAPFECPTEAPFVVEAACVGGGCRVEYTYPDLSAPPPADPHEHRPIPLGVALIRI